MIRFYQLTLSSLVGRRCRYLPTCSAYADEAIQRHGVWAGACFIQAGLDGARFIPRPPRSEALNALSNHYRCGDGRWLMLSIGVAQDAKLWPRFAETIERCELAHDPRFVDRPARTKNARVLVALLDEIFLQRNAEEWMRVLEAKGFVVAQVAQPSEALDDRQMRENGVIVPLQGGGYTVSSPLWMAGVEKAAATPAPKVGEHGETILRERGVTEEQIAELRMKGVLG